MALLKFLKGNYSSLNGKAIAEGQILICGDTGEMFVDVAADKRVKIGDFVVIDTLAKLEALDAASVPTSRLYYVEDGNILARSNGSDWVQINKQPTADQIKTMIGLADYETKTDAAQKLTDAKAYTDELANGQVKANTEAIAKLNGDASTEGSVAKAVADAKALVDADVADVAAIANKNKEDIAAINNEETGILAQAKGYTDTEVAKVQGNVDTLSETVEALDNYVGDIPEGYTQETVIAYINKKAEETLSAAQGGSSETAASVKAALDTYKADNDAAVAAVEDKANAAQTAADAAQAAADAAQADVDALADVIGEVPTDMTVVGMIEEVNRLAGDAMTTATQKVASVTAGDASVTIGGTATAPTVAAKLSADANNALELVEDGLKVVIPAAAEYSIVKAENSGEFAAVYNLTKDGTIVGTSINIPKDLVVKSGSVVDGNIVLVLNDEVNTEITIPAASLIEYVTSGSQTGDMVVINIDDEHKVTASITDGSITLAKLHVDVQTAIGKAHVHDNKEILDGINATMVEAWNAAEQNAKDHADGLNTAMNARVEALEAIDHDHANKALLDTYTQTEADLADAVAKKHAHDNAEELAKVAEGDVAKWNAAEQNAKDYADAQVQALAEGDVADNTAAIAKNAEDIALKANAADVYAKTETYTQEEVDALLTAAMSWGEF